MVTSTLSKHLQQLGYSNWYLFGTHSFRRGGCQYRLSLGWTPGMVAAWGSWTQLEAMTMYRYFYSPNDNNEHLSEYDRNDGKRTKLSHF